MSLDDETKKAMDNNEAIQKERGPGFYADASTWWVAICPSGKHALVGGLGAAGCGQMWLSFSDEDRMCSINGRPPLADVIGELPVHECEDKCSPRKDL